MNLLDYDEPISPQLMMQYVFFRTNIYLKIKLSSEAYRRECEMGWSHQSLTSGNESGYFALSVIRWWQMRIHTALLRYRRVWRHEYRGSLCVGTAVMPSELCWTTEWFRYRTCTAVFMDTAYRSIDGYRGTILSSDISITGEVGYHRAKPECQFPGSRFPLYLSTAWVPRYQWGPRTGGPTLIVQFQTIYCHKYRVKNCYV